MQVRDATWLTILKDAPPMQRTDRFGCLPLWLISRQERESRVVFLLEGLVHSFLLVFTSHLSLEMMISLLMRGD
jgi:hypothetical protein